MKKPNIVFILTDDLGYWSLGCYGNDEVMTPNIDKLSEEGATFNNFYCTSPVCSPARASLLTGKIPSQHGVLDWISEDGEEINYLEEHPGYTDILSQKGYRCGLSGKWHMGDALTPQKGFSDWFAYTKGSGPYYDAEFSDNGQLVHVTEYVTNVITDRGIRFIEESVKENKPFYLHLSYTAPHHPWIDNHPEEYLSLYDKHEFKSIPKEELHPDRTSFTDYAEKNRKANIQGYYASITAVDDDIGKLISRLKELGVYENTLIIFTSDNGFNCGHHGFWGKGNGTFPLNLYDTSVKVPFIAFHPRVIQPQVKIDRAISAYDWFPTILDYVGCDFPLDKSYPGKSFYRDLLSQDSSDDPAVVVFDEYGPTRMITDGNFKYIHRYPYGPNEFYDLEKDPHEKNNLVQLEEYQSQIEVYRSQMQKWFFEYVNPEIDASKEPVTGFGQTGPVGLKSLGKTSFIVPEEIKNKV